MFHTRKCKPLNAENISKQIPVDVLFIYVWSVNNLMGDGLIRHVVSAANAN